MKGPVPGATTWSTPSGIIQPLIDCVKADLKDIERFYNCTFSVTRIHRLRTYLRIKLDELLATPFNQLDLEDQTDFLLLQKYLNAQLNGLKSFEDLYKELEPIVEPFTSSLVDLLERRQKVVPIDGKQAADILTSACTTIKETRCMILGGQIILNHKPNHFAAYRATHVLNELKFRLEEWLKFYSGYDPVFTWWTTAPCNQTLSEIQLLIQTVRDKIDASNGSAGDIVGQPIGREGLLKSLDEEFIAYSPEELISIAEREYAWSEHEMVEASKALGYGRDWKDALEHVKNIYVEPGQQTYLVHELAEEAVTYVKKNDMVTVPAIAEECWKTLMMTPERQKVNPFFLGGRDIIVSYPTDTMSHSDKLMSMRGNNRPFSRSTVFHELIPGHHLQMHMIARHRSYRSLFTTPFWIEGWAFYWEFILWDRGFASTPEEKIGMLFWRMHRCARIVFSLKFHLGDLTPQQCIDYLVEKVGHERATAEGEVRRSFNGDYSPLYQAGYMLGALQFYAMRKEMVDEGGMKEKDFHNRILREGEMPIELLRALLKGQKLKSEHKASWKFYDL